MSNQLLSTRYGIDLLCARIRFDLTQEEMCALSGISVPTLIAIEKGRAVSPECVESYGTAVDWLQSLEALRR